MLSMLNISNISFILIILFNFINFINITNAQIINNRFTTKLNTITLTNDNFVSLRGPVSSISISNLINNLISKTADVRYIYLNTNGGSVDAGLKLVNVIQGLEDNNIVVNCIADTAISMGFVIFQFCNNCPISI